MLLRTADIKIIDNNSYYVERRFINNFDPGTYIKYKNIIKCLPFD